MRLFKRITAAALAGLLISAPAYATYEFGNLKQFYSFEDYDYEYDGKTQPEPTGFVYTNNGVWRSSKGYYLDNERKSKTFKFPAHNTETALKFGTIVDSGMLHLSYDIYQGYTTENDASKGRTIVMMLSRNATAVGEGWYHGDYVTDTLFDQYDPEAIKFNSDAYQHVLETSRYNVVDNNFINPVIESKGPITYYNNAQQWNGTAVSDPDGVMDWKEWNKLDIYINKDDNTFTVYLNGEELRGEGYNVSTGKYDGSYLPGTFNSDPKYKAIKGVVFRAQTANMMNGARGDVWHVGNTGYFLIDNMYAKQYTGDKDIISIATDDANGNGVALTNGTLNVAYSEYMASPATKADVTIENTLTGEEVTDFEITNSDGMQFLVNFGSTSLDPGQYKVTVSNIKGKITGENVALPGYFNTVENNKAWVKNVECLRIDGVPLERGRAVSSATTAIRVTFTEPVNMTNDNAASFFKLEGGGKTEEISKAIVSEDCTSVVLYPKNLFLPGSESKLNVLNTLTTKSGNAFIDAVDGNVSEEIIPIANDPLCSYGQEFNYDSENNTATFSVDVVKSDTSEIKYTMVAASYKDVVDEKGNKVPQMLDIEYIPISINSDDRVLKEYITNAVDCTGADRVKAFIWDYPSFEIIYSYEEEIQGGAE